MVPPLLLLQDAVYGYLGIAALDKTCKSNIDKFCERGPLRVAPLHALRGRRRDTAEARAWFSLEGPKEDM